MRFKKIVALSLLSIAGLLAATITPVVASAASNKPIIVGSKMFQKVRLSVKFTRLHLSMRVIRLLGNPIFQIM